MYIFQSSLKLAACALALPTLLACASPHTHSRRANRKLTLYGTDDGDLGLGASKAKAYDEVTLIPIGGNDYQIEGGWGPHKIAMAGKSENREKWLEEVKSYRKQGEMLAAGFELDESQHREWWIIMGGNTENHVVIDY